MHDGEGTASPQLAAKGPNANMPRPAPAVCIKPKATLDRALSCSSSSFCESEGRRQRQSFAMLQQVESDILSGDNDSPECRQADHGQQGTERSRWNASGEW